jgi:hypothetical protein
VLQQVVHAVRGGEYRAPRTILAFLGSIVAITAAMVVGLSFALSGSASLHFVIIGAAVFVVILICVAVGIVVIFAWKNPSKLLLGQVSAKDYIAIQTMGDDVYGEYLEPPDAKGEALPRSSVQSSDTPQIQPPDEGQPK